MKDLEMLIDQIESGIIDTEQALKYFNQSLNLDFNNMGIEREAGQSQAEYTEDILHIPQSDNNLMQAEVATAVGDYLLRKVSTLLGVTVSEIEQKENFLDLGLASTQLIKMTDLIEEDLRITLYPTILFEYQNITLLGEYLTAEFGDKLKDSFGIKETKKDNKIESKDKKQVVQEKKKNEVRKQDLPDIGDLKSPREKRTRDIAVVGIGGKFPGGSNLDELWDTIQNGKDAVSEIKKERWDWQKVKKQTGQEIRWGGFIEDIDKFDASFFGISPREAEMMDPQQRILIETIWHTIEDAGYKTSDISGTDTGLFIGISTNDYAELMIESDTPIEAFTSIGTVHSIVANRISYIFNLHGPSMAIDTACSSSLVALSEAICAIRNGKCDAAVVGGVNALLSPKLFVSFNKAGMLSEDGRCKTFDKSANGYVRGEGVGAVLVKSLERAEADGDHIYAVIKGCAVNHGGHANSMTAPNPKAQAELIVSALKDANLDMSTISYIEAHGTGTALGDPIEIEGLKKAYKKSVGNMKVGFDKACGIGTIKTNIGHLESAAGIAGLIKLILSMENKKIAGIRNFNEQNPYIDLSDTPFYIAEKTTEWKTFKDEQNREIPRRAGLSSFGFGGTNAHIILEEYWDRIEKTEEEMEPQIIPLSAKTENQLKSYVKEMIGFIESNNAKFREVDGRQDTESDLSRIITEFVAEILGIEYKETYAEEMFSELGFAMKEYDDLVSRINESFQLNFTTALFSVATKARLVARHVGYELQSRDGSSRSNTQNVVSINLKDIAYTLQTGRDEMNERLAVVAGSVKELGVLLHAYINGDESCIYRDNVKNSKLGAVLADSAGNSYFVSLMKNREYDKLAQLWVSGAVLDWKGLDMNTGQKKISLPTYPFDKKRYWISRETCDKDRSKAVNGINYPLLGQNISTLSEQKFDKELTGEEFYLRDHIVNKRKLFPGAAYIEMAREAGELAGEQKVTQIKNIVWNKPFYVNDEPRKVNISLYEEEGIGFDIWQNGAGQSEVVFACGTMEYEAEANNRTEERIDIDEIKQRCSVRTGKDVCYERFRQMGLEYGEAFRTINELYSGSGEALSVLTLPEAGRDNSGMTLHPSLLDGAFQSVLGCIGMDRIQGTYVPYELGNLTIINKIPENCTVYSRLQGEESDGYRFMFQICDDSGKVVVKGMDFRIHRFVQTGIDAEDSSLGDSLYCDSIWEEEPAEEWNNNIESVLIFDTDDVLYRKIEESADAILVLKGNSYRKNSEHVYEVSYEQENDYLNLFEQLKSDNHIPDKILYNWSSINTEQMEEKLAEVIYPLQRILKTLIRTNRKKEIEFIYLYQTGKTGMMGLDVATGSLLKSLTEEDSRFNYKTIGFSSQIADSIKLGKSTTAADLIIGELRKKGNKSICYKDDKRFVLTLKEHEGGKESFVNPEIKDGGVYVITGGTGGLGFKFARYIASCVKAKIVLMNKGVFKEEKKQKLAELEQNGTEFLYVQVDLGIKKEVQNAVQSIIDRFGVINGVIHCAGLLRDSLMRNQDEEDFKAVIVPKINGTIYLDEATKNQNQDFFILFSSIASVIGNAGQTAYSFGNGYMDWYAAYRNSLVKQGLRFGKTVSINWPLWKTGGMNVSTEVEKSLRYKGMQLLPEQAGIEGLKKALKTETDQLVMFHGNKDKIKRSYHIGASRTDKGENVTSLAEVNKDTALQFGRSITEIAAHLLHMPKQEINLEQEMNEFGFDSILLTDFSNTLNEQYGIHVTPDVFYAHSTLGELSEHLYVENKQLLNERFKEAISSTAENKSTSIVRQERIPEAKSEMKKASILRKKIELGRTRGAGKKAEHRDIAIIGISGRMPQAKDLEQYFNNLEQGIDCITEIPKERWDWRDWYGDPRKEADKTNVKWGGFMPHADKFDPLFFGISPTEAELMDPQQRLFMETVWKTIEDAGYRASNLSGTNTGIFVGVSTNDYYEQLIERGAEIKAQTATGKASSIIPNRISYLLNLSGPSEPVDTACSSALVAVYRAVRSIQNGDCDMAIAGGVNVLESPALFVSFNKAGMLSSDGRCKTFDQSANGYVRGEGVGAVLLKPVTQAEADGDHIYAVIKGCAINHGGRANSLTAPNPKAQTELLVKAYKEAEIAIDTVTYLEAHGTGTSLGDPIEISALKQAYKELSSRSDNAIGKNCGIGAVKTNIGHLESAAGIAGLLKVILSMKNGKIPGILHFKNQSPYIDLTNSPFYIINKTKPWNRLIDVQGNEIPRRAGISAFGFGGGNAHVVLEEYIDKRNIDNEEGEVQIIPLSARTEEQLKQYAINLKDYLSHKKKEKTVCIQNEDSTIIKQMTEFVSESLQIEPATMDRYDNLKNMGFTVKEYDDLINKINDTYGLNKTTSLFTAAESIYEIAQVIGKECVTENQTELIDFSETSDPVSLKDLAYTLQVGREKMKERLAIVTNSTKALFESLEAYLNGSIDDIYHGNTRQDQMVSLFTKGDTGNDYLNALIAKREYKKIAELWVHGAEIDWKKLHGEAAVRRISLPTYPFEEKSFWLPPYRIEKRFEQKASCLHPLLHQNISTLEEQMFCTEFDGNEFFLQDHIVNQKKVFPGSAYLEMVRIAGELAGKTAIDTISEISWIKEFIMDKEPQIVNISLFAKLDEIMFEVWSKDKNGNERIYSQGILAGSEEKGGVEQIHLEEIKARCSGYVSKDECYLKFQNMGLEYRECFRTIQELHIGQDECLGVLELPVMARKGTEMMKLHPSLLDGAFQSVIGCITAEEVDVPYVPYRLGKLSINRKIPEHCYVYAILTQKEKGGFKFDFKVFGEDGTVVVNGEGFRVRRNISRSAGMQEILETTKKVMKEGKDTELVSENVEKKDNNAETDILKKNMLKGIVKAASELLHIQEQEIDPDEEMSNYGFDSIMLTDFSNLLNKKYNIHMTPAIFYAHSSLAKLADYLCLAYKEIVTGHFGMYEAHKDESPVKTQGVARRQESLKENSISVRQKTRNRNIGMNRAEIMAGKGGVSDCGTKDIAVIGISGVMPQARNLHEYWENLNKGKDCISEIPPERWDWREWFGEPSDENKTNVKWGGFMPDVDKFDPIFFGISPLEAELMDPQQRIFMETVWKTIEDAGYRPSDFSGSDTGLFVGVSTNDYHEQLTRQDMEIVAQTSTGKATSILPNRISFMMNLTGPSEPVDTACSSALVAVHRAIRAIQNNDCSLAIAGGINVLASPTLFVSFNKAGMLSPDGRCKTFDEKANGYVRGEGTGAVLLKKLDQAEKDGDYIYAVIKGSAVNHGGHANSMTAPNPNAQTKLLVKAYEEAGVPFDTITYLEAHGTGTPLGDPIEINALKQASIELGKASYNSDNRNRCGISAVKTNIGHLESAAGIAGLLKVILSMKYGKIPGILHFNRMNTYIDLEDSPFYIVNKTKEWERLSDENDQEIPRRAGVSAFGFGGANAHIVLEEYRDR